VEGLSGGRAGAARMTDQEKKRLDFLIAMYNQLMGDINRHIVVIWQSVGVLLVPLQRSP